MEARVRVATSHRRCSLRFLPLATLLLAALAMPASAVKYASGERIEITGIVSDSQGTLLPDLKIVLEASRRSFSIRHFHKIEVDSVRVSSVTDERGEYSVHWPWDEYYNHFELLVTVGVRDTEGEKLRILERVDLTPKIKKGNPVVATVSLEDTEFLTSFREFLASLRSEDQKRLYRDMGKPDELKTIDLPQHREVSWWYFESGKVYRFRDGTLVQVIHFDPVEEF
jgi:hypothetical protein